MRKLTGFKVLALCLGALSTASVSATGDAVAGHAKAFACMGCHGVPSYTNAYPTYHVPKLGGQHAQYLVTALTEYKNGQRSHTTMHAQAASLSEQDIEDIAAYFEAAKD